MDIASLLTGAALMFFGILVGFILSMSSHESKSKDNTKSTQILP